MLIIGENGKDFDPFACLECPVRDDCAMAQVAGEVGGAIIARGIDTENYFSELVTNVVLGNESTAPTPFEIKHGVVELFTYMDALKAYKSRMRKDLTDGLRVAAKFVDEFLGDAGEDPNRVEGYDPVDEMRYTATRAKILDWFNSKKSILDTTRVTTQDLISGVLALERHEPSKVCRAVQLRNDNDVKIESVDKT